MPPQRLAQHTHEAPVCRLARSLTTLTPILADTRLAEAYTFLTSAGAMLRPPSSQGTQDDAVLGACALLATSGPEQLAAPRQALAQLRERLNLKAHDLLGRLVQEGAQAAATNTVGAAPRVGQQASAQAQATGQPQGQGL